MSNTTEQIKDRLGIVEVVSQYVKLEKAGQNLKAKCPFHNEKTPSFTVSPARNTFYCFGCNESGDIFTFVEKFEGVDFMGALKALGEKAGVQITFENTESRDERAKLYTALEDATAFFTNNLAKEKKVLKYLKERGLTEETLQSFQIGYVRDEWRTLYEHMTAKKYRDEDLLAAGLIKKTDEGRYYDLFRGRIMFPLRDASGRVIAFSGRIFSAKGGSASGGKGDDGKAPKYVNSPETPLFNKSKVLYGYDRAKLSIRKFNFSIVVEGQMDLLMSHQAGFPNTVAVSGTALTGEQLALLQRLSNNIVLALDADNAGLRSAGKGATLALSRGMDVKVAEMPPGSDPADLVKKGKEVWKKAVRNSKHIIDTYLEVLQETIKDKRKLRLEAERTVIPFVARIKNNIDQAHFIGRVAHVLAIPEEAVWEAVRSAPLDKTPGDTLSETAQHTPHTHSRKEIIAQSIALLFSLGKGTPELKKRFKESVGEKEYKTYITAAKKANEDALFQAERLFNDITDSEAYLSDLLLNLEREQCEESVQEAFAHLTLTEAKGDQKKIEQAEKRYKKTMDILTNIKAQLLDEDNQV